MMKRKERDMSKLKADEYQKRLNATSLISVHLSAISAKLDPEALKPPPEVEISDGSSYEAIDKDHIVITHEYHLVAAGKSTKTPFIEIKATFSVKLTCKEKFDKSFFSLYSEISLPLLTYPFFRELVNNTTSRMGIPPLTLPFIRTTR